MKSQQDSYSLILVDDDENLLKDLSEGLNLLGFECLAFSDPEQAVEQCLCRPPDLMIVDFEMPKYNGLQVIKMIRQKLNHEAPPLLMVSGITCEDKITESFDYGIVDFISKPVSLILLKAKILNIIKTAQKDNRSSPASHEQPLQFGDYIIEQELGRGGMGVVYRARNTKTNQVVALKTLIATPDNTTALLRFRREIDLLVTLDHPHLTKFYEAGRSKAVFYYSMELIQGQSLESKIQEHGPIDPAQLTKICHDICGTLAHIHKLNLVHRDIKPANIMISPIRGAILTDFGLSKYRNDTQLTETNQLVGTVHFMAPEYILGQEQTNRSDIFCLGLVCIEALLGEPLFNTDNAYTIMQSIVNGNFPTSRDLEQFLRITLPPTLKKTLDRMLCLDPKYRFPNAEAVQQSLMTPH